MQKIVMVSWEQENEHERISWDDDDGVIYTDKDEKMTLHLFSPQAGLRAVRTFVGLNFGSRAYKILDKTETVIDEKILFPLLTQLGSLGFPQPGQVLMCFYNQLGLQAAGILTNKGYRIADRGYQVVRI